MQANWDHHEETPPPSVPERANRQQDGNDDVAATSRNEDEESLRALLEQEKRLNRRIETKIQTEAKKAKRTPAEYFWAQSATPQRRNRLRDTQVRTALLASQHQASIST